MHCRITFNLIGAVLIFLGSFSTGFSQGDCPYPVIFIHGWTGNQSSFASIYNDPTFASIWGNLAGVHHAVLNASTSTNIWGSNGIAGDGDDDVLVSFSNWTNNLPPGCIYAVNFENYWNENPGNPQIEINDGSSPSFFESDGNESALYKHGYALHHAIQKVLQANPGKQKVILVGHSMGGLSAREYLQRDGGIWWVGGSNGHAVAKLVTAATPHLGSNTLGNISFNPKDEDYPEKDGFPDLASEAVRDMRYSYACGFLLLSDCSSPYMFGGSENDIPGLPFPYWNDDVNCNGSENDFVPGINQAGGGDPWDGTTDNNAMPLPQDIRYTWVTSAWVSGGDGVIDINRQWLHNGNIPVPHDGTPHRLTDTLKTDLFHTSVNDDLNLMAQSLDEGDYPAYAWELEMNKTLAYTGMVQRRSANTPEGGFTTDPDWYSFYIAPEETNNLCITLVPNPALSGRLDYFKNPSNYESHSSQGDIYHIFNAGSGTITLNILAGNYQAGATNYIRVSHDGVSKFDWANPFQIQIESKLPTVAIDLISFEGEKINRKAYLKWSTQNEINHDYYEIQSSLDNRKFESLGKIFSNSETFSQIKNYQFIDEKPYFAQNLYRLAYFDLNGDVNYSHIISLDFTALQEASAVFPNPFQSELNIPLFHQNEKLVELRLIDQFGKMAKHYSTNSSFQGEMVKWDTSKLPSGFYILEIRQNQKFIRHKLLKT